MMDNFYNILLIVCFLGIGIYLIYNTYKNPSSIYSTNIKGYVAGLLFIMIAVFSLFGKFSILEELKELFTK